MIDKCTMKFIYCNFLFLIFLIRNSENRECGVGENKIFLGDYVEKLQDFPYVFQLLLFGDQLCGCSAIHEKYILTAASCLDSESNSRAYDVIVGSLKANRGGVKIKVRNIFIHYSYKAETLNYNVAVLILKKAIKFNKNVKPVIVTQFPPARGFLMWTAGWGMHGRRNKYSISLRYLKAKIVSNDECGSFNEVTRMMICAKYQHTDQNIGLGDAGGPLMLFNQNVQYGIASWGSIDPSICFEAQAYANISDSEIGLFIMKVSGVRIGQIPS